MAFLTSEDTITGIRKHFLKVHLQDTGRKLKDTCSKFIAVLCPLVLICLIAWYLVEKMVCDRSYSEEIHYMKSFEEG